MSTFRRVMAHVDVIDGLLAGTIDHAGLARLRDDLIEQVRPPARWVLAPLGDDEWLIGPEEAPTRHRCTLVGLRAAHQALAGLQPTCAELRPGKSQPENIIHHAIHVTAVKWLDGTAKCPALAEVLRARQGISIKGGRVRYTKLPHAPEVITEAPAAPRHADQPSKARITWPDLVWPPRSGLCE